MPIYTVYNNIIFRIFSKVFNTKQTNQFFVLTQFSLDVSQKLCGLSNSIGEYQDILPVPEKDTGEDVGECNCGGFSVPTRCGNGNLLVVAGTVGPPFKVALGRFNRLVIVSLKEAS